MNIQKNSVLFDKANDLEYRLCVFFNRLSLRRGVTFFFRIVSRLGDGVFWYVLMLALPFLFGYKGIVVGLGMIAVALVNVSIYKFLKNRFVRERPYILHKDLVCGIPPLDRYSFPSGHTLHAVSFTFVSVSFFSALSPLLISMAFLIAMSRLVLGLHYLSDVVMGAVLGLLIAFSSVFLIEQLV